MHKKNSYVKQLVDPHTGKRLTATELAEGKPGIFYYLFAQRKKVDPKTGKPLSEEDLAQDIKSICHNTFLSRKSESNAIMGWERAKIQRELGLKEFFEKKITVEALYQSLYDQEDINALKNALTVWKETVYEVELKEIKTVLKYYTEGLEDIQTVLALLKEKLKNLEPQIHSSKGFFFNKHQNVELHSPDSPSKMDDDNFSI